MNILARHFCVLIGNVVCIVAFMRMDALSLMNLRSLKFAIAGLLAISSAALVSAQAGKGTAGEFIKAVINNELKDRTQQRHWMYAIEKRDGKQMLKEEQVETKDGPLYRVLAMDGVPLNPDQRQQEDSRIDRLLRDPGQQLKVKQRQDDDEKKLQSLMQLMPRAFLFDYDGMEGSLVRLKFRPNPGYSPQSYEERVICSLGGAILIDPQQERLAKISGQMMNAVKFGFGLFGRVDNGGTMEFGRKQVGAAQWKTNLINVQLTGKMVLFKTLNKQQYETRSNFRSVANDLNLTQASELLRSASLHANSPKAGR